MKDQEIVDFVREMKPTDHVIMFYSKLEDKREVQTLLTGIYRSTCLSSSGRTGK